MVASGGERVREVPANKASREMTKVTPDDYRAIAFPATYADDARLHEIFTAMRREAPVTFIEAPGFPPFWAVTKHADIIELERQNDRFINEERAVLQTLDVEQRVRQLTGGSANPVRSLVQMDNPDHARYRRLTQSWFLRSSLRKLEPELQRLAAEFVDRMALLGGACDFAADVAAWYPLRVIMAILGVPPEDEPLMLRLTQELFGPEDPDMQRQQQSDADLFQALMDFNEYFGRLTAERRARPKDDVATIIATAEIDGQPLPEFERNSYYTIIATAGHDTTSSSIAGGLLALMQHPEELARLRDDLGKLPTAAEEMVRWVTPVKHFMRTATEDYELRQQQLRAGDALMLCYASGNRDEEVFDEPFRFRVDRDPNPHLAFGFGAHLCLGRVLAKMELEALYRELLTRVAHIELAGEPRLVQSAFVSGLKTLPVRYRMA
jgi:cytochrome P450